MQPMTTKDEGGYLVEYPPLPLQANKRFTGLTLKPWLRLERSVFPQHARAH